MFDFPLARLDADVVTALELPELMVEVTLEVGEAEVDEAVVLDARAVELDL